MRGLTHLVKKQAARIGLEISRRPKAFEPAPLCFDDFLRALAFGGMPPEMRLVQVGANDGKRNDPAFRFIYENRINAIFIEPQPDIFRKLKSNYSEIADSCCFLNCAISTHEAKVDFWVPKAVLRERLPRIDGAASFSQAHLIRTIQRNRHHFANIQSPETQIEKIGVNAMSLSRIFENYNLGLFEVILVVDTEGHDKDVIFSLNFDVFEPFCIFFEHIHLSSSDWLDCLNFLASRGYVLRKDGQNTLAYLTSLTQCHPT